MRFRNVVNRVEDAFNTDEILTSTPKRKNVTMEIESNVAANITVSEDKSVSQSVSFGSEFNDITLDSVKSPNSPNMESVTTECYFCGDIMGIHHVNSHLREAFQKV